MQLGNIEYVCDTDQHISQQLKVGGLCSGWPFWAFAASAACMTVEWIHGTTPAAIQLAQCTEYPTINDLTAGATVDVLLLDHGVWKTSRPLISVLRDRCIIIEGVSRRSGLSAEIWPSFFRISHAQTAGMSNSVLPYCVISVSEVFGQYVRCLEIPNYPQVHLSSILSCTVEDGKATTRATPGKGVHGPGDLFSLRDDYAVVHANCVTQYPRFGRVDIEGMSLRFGPSIRIWRDTSLKSSWFVVTACSTPETQFSVVTTFVLFCAGGGMFSLCHCLGKIIFPVFTE